MMSTFFYTNGVDLKTSVALAEYHKLETGLSLIELKINICLSL